jgi:hypothetical protein
MNQNTSYTLGHDRSIFAPAIKFLVVMILPWSGISFSEPGSSPTEQTKSIWNNASEKAGDYWETASKKAEEANRALTGEKTSKQWRQESRYVFLVDYSPFDLIVPGKKGISMAYNESVERIWELEYLTGSISGPSAFEKLGSINEKRLSLLNRNFWNRNSFSGFLGISWNSFEVSVGNDLLTKLGVVSAPKSELLRLDTLGINVGLGNRWTLWKGVTIGSDWIGISQPLFTIDKNMSVLDQAGNRPERDKVETALKTALFLPRLYVLKIQIGMMF